MKVEECIVNVRRSQKYPGLLEIGYRIPEKDARGNVIPGKYRNIERAKTVYDPLYYTDEQIAEWGREAMRGAKRAGRKNGPRYKGKASNGMEFVGYIDPATGEFKNYFPVLD